MFAIAEPLNLGIYSLTTENFGEIFSGTEPWLIQVKKLSIHDTFLWFFGQQKCMESKYLNISTILISVSIDALDIFGCKQRVLEPWDRFGTNM